MLADHEGVKKERQATSQDLEMDLTSLTLTVKVYSVNTGSGIAEAMFRVGRMCVVYSHSTLID